MEWLQAIDFNLTGTEMAAHSAIFLINILLFIFARPIIGLVDTGREDSDTKVYILRTLNVMVLVLHLIDLVFNASGLSYEQYFYKLGLSLMVLYLSLFSFSILSLLSRKKFGQEKSIDDKSVYLDTYNSRLIDLLVLVVIIITAVYTIIKIWGADSLLETTGIFGILAAFLAFTSSIWAPDLFSGLIILNAQILEDGDVIVVDGYPDEYIISRVSFIYVLLNDVRNNHRTLIRNSHFLKSKIDNLSRVASLDGIRRSLSYKVGYPEFDGDNAEKRLEQYDQFTARVNRLFDSVFEQAVRREDIKINNKREFEWAITETGDFALEITLWFYLDRIPRTKVTSTIRKHLIRTPYHINALVYRASIAEQVSLATPELRDVRLLGQEPQRQQVLSPEAAPETADTQQA